VRTNSSSEKDPLAGLKDGDSFLVTRLDTNETFVRQAIQISPLRDIDDPRYAVVFVAKDLPPLGMVVFKISPLSSSCEPGTDPPQPMLSQRYHFRGRIRSGLHGRKYSNGQYSATFHPDTGLLLSISKGNATTNISQIWGYYTSFDNSRDSSQDNSANNQQNSGAYIFRPSSPEQALLQISALRGKAEFIESPDGIEAHASFTEPWIRQVTRLTYGLPYVEIVYTIGPIPVDDGRGKEIVTRYITSIESGGHFYTDSNGRHFVQRQRNYRPSWNLNVYEPVAGNFYPVNSAMYIEDDSHSFGVVVDRSMAGASLSDNSLEFLVQRRTLADDARGVSEPLNETTEGMSPYPPFGNASRLGKGVIVRGIHRLVIGENGLSGSTSIREVMDESFAEPLVLVGTAVGDSRLGTGRSALAGLPTPLPENVMLLTYSRQTDFRRLSPSNSSYIVRLGHQLEARDKEERSLSVDVDLAVLFPGHKIASVVAKTLSGNQDLVAWKQKQNQWTIAKPTSSVRTSPIQEGLQGNWTVTLAPMEIGTYFVVLE
jgi:Glycosyl hydrolases family 38 C-terminal domain